jgi:hypothetical protein
MFKIGLQVNLSHKIILTDEIGRNKDRAFPIIHQLFVLHKKPKPMNVQVKKVIQINKNYLLYHA